MFCKKCGVELAPDAKFCNRCGAKIAPEETPENTERPGSSFFEPAPDLPVEPLEKAPAYSAPVEEPAPKGVEEKTAEIINEKEPEIVTEKEPEIVEEVAPAIKKSKKKPILITVAVLCFLGIIGAVVALLPKFMPNQSATPAQVQEGYKNTIMFYLDGTDIESGVNRRVKGCMTKNIQTALDSGIDTERNNVLFYTGGCSKWHDFDIPSDKDCIYIIKDGKLTLLEEFSPQNMADPDTLEDFITYCKTNYPADKYSLIMADHGGGPNLGLCQDERTGKIMSISNLVSALEATGFEGENKLEIICFDACLMGSVEVAAALKDHANYMVASENPSISSGGDYSFIAAYNNAQSGADIGKAYVDKFYAESVSEGKRLGVLSLLDATYSCIDLSKIDEVIKCADTFFETATDDIDTNYSLFARNRENTKGVFDTGSDTNTSTKFYYDLIDLYDFVSKHKNTYKTEAESLLKALDNAIIYEKATSNGMNGLTFYFPYKSPFFRVYSSLCFSDEYAKYISAFTNERSRTTSYDGLFSSVIPTQADDALMVSMDLTAEQVEEFSYGEYFIFAKPKNLVKNDQPMTLPDDEYMFVSNGFDVKLDNNQLKATLNGNGYYAVYEGNDLLFPVYSKKDGDKVINYTNVSLSYVPSYEDETEDLDVLVEAIENMKLDVGRMYFDITDSAIKISVTYILNENGLYDRSPIDINAYNDISFDTFAKKVSYDSNSNILPFDEWEMDTSTLMRHVHAPDELSLKVKPLDENADYFVMLVAHDIYGNKNCSGIIPLNLN